MQTVRRKYTYFISFDGGTNYSQFYPNRGVKLTKERQDGQKFYRTTCSEIVISNKTLSNAGTAVNATVFTTLSQWYFDRTKTGTEIKIRIYNNYTRSAVTYWDGYLNITGCKLHFDQGAIAFTPLPDDNYRHLLNWMDVEYNIFEFYKTKYSPVATMVSTTEYCYAEDTEEECEGGTSGEWIYCGMITYATDPTIYTTYNLNPVINYREYRRQRIPFQPYGTTGWVEIGDYWYADECNVQTVEAQFSNFFKVSDIVQAFLDELELDYGVPSFTYVSQFFLNSDGGTTNYITGATNLLPYLLMAQKSDVRFPTASNKASIGMMTFGKLLDILHNMFDTYWYIDSNGDFRIEHERYFLYGLSADTDVSAHDIDLTDANKYDSNYQRGLQDYDYDKIAYNAEEWKFMEAWHYDWQTARCKIEYDIALDKRTVTPHDLSTITTDLQGIMSYTDKVSDEGFVFVYCDSTYEIRTEEGVVSGVSYINGHLSIANLLDKYWRYNRLILTGEMNGDDVVFLSDMRTRKSSVIYRIYEPDVDEVDPYKLKRIKFISAAYVLGTQDGEIDSAVHDLETDVVEADLLFNNPASASETFNIMVSTTDAMLIDATDNLIFYP